MKTINIFNSSLYKEFNFSNDYLKICSSIEPYTNLILINNGKFIAPLSYLELDKIQSCNNKNILVLNSVKNIMSKSIIEDQGLFYGEIKSDLGITETKTNQNIIKIFSLNLLISQLNWLEKYLHCLMEHLATRETSSMKLINLPIIKIMLAEVIASINLSSQYISCSAQNYSRYFTAITAQEILKSAKLLCRLAGGRSFLKGSLVSMINLFVAIRTVYFMDPVGDSNDY